MSEKVNTVKAGGKTAVFSGTHYESYLQIFKTPEKAVANYARYLELNDREKREQPLSDAEKKELAKLKRTETLAKDFDNSHNYMLDKERYRQQDIDYAFALGEKERQGGARGDLFERHRSASDVYKASILEKIFRGFKERITKSPEEGGMSAVNIDPNELTNWLDEDMSTAAAKKMADMRMILIGLKKSLGETDQDSMFEAVQNLFEESWFPFVLPPGKGDDRIKTLALRAPHAFYQVMGNPEKKFQKLIQKLITMVLNEDKSDSLIELKKNANKRAGAAKPA